MSSIQFTDVQLTNLYLLQAIRLGIAQDRVSTCCKFGLDAAQADFLGAMSQEQLWAFVDQIGQSTLFPPRQDLLALLKAPRRFRHRWLLFMRQPRHSRPCAASTS